MLVGHSIGGDVAVKYARTYRRGTAGVVLFDATRPGYLQYVLRLIPAGAHGVAAALRAEDIFAPAPRCAGRLLRHRAGGRGRLAQLSRRSQLVIAADSGHYIYLGQPQLALDVVDAIIGET